MKKIKLTNKNYHQQNSDFLTSSKIKAYLASPWYYYQRYVKKTIKDEPTDAMILGSAVDTLVTGSKASFNRLYKPVARRIGTEGLGYTEMTAGAHAEALAIGTAVRKTTAFKELKGFKRQVVLTGVAKVGKIGGKDYEMPICGMLDFLKVEGNKATICDLKTARSANDRKYYYHALEYGYFNQASFYRKLVLANYPGVKQVDFYHLVVSKENKNFYQIKTFKFHDKVLESADQEVGKTILEIASRTSWQPDDCNFESAIELGAPLMAEKAEGDEIED